MKQFLSKTCSSLLQLALLFSLVVAIVCPTFLHAATPEESFPVTGIYANYPITGSFQVASAEPLQLEKLSASTQLVPEPTSELSQASLEPKAEVKYVGYKPWFQTDQLGHLLQTSDQHLIQDHKADPTEVAGLSPEEKNRLHGKLHGEQLASAKVSSSVKIRTTAPVVQQSGGCPGGQCPAQVQHRSRLRLGFFRR